MTALPELLTLAVVKASTFLMGCCVAAAFSLFVVGTSTADVLAPGLYDGHPPAGQLSRNNVLSRPHGRSKGIVMIVHGGGWLLVGKNYMAGSAARWFVQHGYTSYDVDYRAGRDSLVDVVAAYDHLRRDDEHATICAYGESAGGTLVELLAASRPSLDCLVTEAGVEDMRSWVAQCSTRACDNAAFGADVFSDSNLWQFSPIRLIRRIHPPWIAAGSTADPIVDERAQLAELHAADPNAHTMLLQGAPTPNPWVANFTHANVTPAALARFQHAVLRLLRESEQSHRVSSRRAR